MIYEEPAAWHEQANVRYALLKPIIAEMNGKEKILYRVKRLKSIRNESLGISNYCGDGRIYGICGHFAVFLCVSTDKTTYIVGRGDPTA